MKNLLDKKRIASMLSSFNGIVHPSSGRHAFVYLFVRQNHLCSCRCKCPCPATPKRFSIVLRCCCLPCPSCCRPQRRLARVFADPSPPPSIRSSLRKRIGRQIASHARKCLQAPVKVPLHLVKAVFRVFDRHPSLLLHLHDHSFSHFWCKLCRSASW